MPSAVVLAALSLVLVLLVSAVAKLVSGDDIGQTVRSLGLPEWLVRVLTTPVLVGAELVLAVGLLLAPAPVFAVVAAATLVLMLAYLIVVVRLLATPAPSCNCFGTLGASELTRWSVARNVVLVVAAVLTLVDALTGHSLIGRLLGLGSAEWLWLAGAGAVAALTVLVRGVGNQERDPSKRETGEPEMEDLEDYQRLPVPWIPIELPAGEQGFLPDLVRERAQLLVFLSTTCGSCRQITAQLGQWRAEVPELDIRVVTTEPPEATVPPEWGSVVLHDRDGRVGNSFVTGVPAAVLLGADSWLAGGPVLGQDAVEEFYAEIHEQLVEQRAGITI